MENNRRMASTQEPAPSMGKEYVAESSLRKIMEHFQAQNHQKDLRIGVALGSYGLVHAGTVSFLRQAKEQCDYLIALILPDPGSNPVQLLQPEERVRMLNALLEVEGVALAKAGDMDLEDLPHSFPESVWFHNESEADVGANVLNMLSVAGAHIQALAGDASCTTEILLRRMAHGKTS